MQTYFICSNWWKSVLRDEMEQLSKSTDFVETGLRHQIRAQLTHDTGHTASQQPKKHSPLRLSQCIPSETL